MNPEGASWEWGALRLEELTRSSRYLVHYYYAKEFADECNINVDKIAARRSMWLNLFCPLVPVLTTYVTDIISR